MQGGLPPGAGAPPTYTQPTIPRYRNILNSGRGLYLLAEPDEVEPILAVLLPEGLFLRTLVDNEDEADELLKKVARWSARGEQFARAEVPRPNWQRLEIHFRLRQGPLGWDCHGPEHGRERAGSPGSVASLWAGWPGCPALPFSPSRAIIYSSSQARTPPWPAWRSQDGQVVGGRGCYRVTRVRLAA